MANLYALSATVIMLLETILHKLKFWLPNSFWPVKVQYPRYYEHLGTVKICSPCLEFVLIGVLCITMAILRGQGRFVLTLFVLTRVY